MGKDLPNPDVVYPLEEIKRLIPVLTSGDIDAVKRAIAENLSKDSL